jgi:outer membrane protein assembly factor BamD
VLRLVCAAMKRWPTCLVLILIVVVFMPLNCPAPLVYRPGEGWSYEAPGSVGKWHRDRAKSQLEVAQEAYDDKEYRLAIKAARRVTKVWPLSDYAPKAQYLLGRAREERHQDNKAFWAFQKALEQYPKIENYEEILQRQKDIADRFLAGQRFKLFGYIPISASMSRTIKMYEEIVKTGPYSEVAPQAQMSIGAAHERKKTFGIWKTPNYSEAAKAYKQAADRYIEQPEVAADALFKEGIANQRQAKTAEYDQNVAGQAIAVFTDFIALYPDDQRVSEARDIISSLKAEQARGSFRIARFYEKRKRWQGALVYYSDVLNKDPHSQYAEEAKKRIDNIKKRTSQE